MKRSRKPKEPDKLDWEPMDDEFAMRGMVDFLRTDLTQHRPVLIEMPPRTVATEPATTVVTGPASTVECGSVTTVAPEPTATVVADPRSTVVAAPAPTVDLGPDTTVVWTAEGFGGIFPASRIKRISKAQDALTHAEEAVYDTLWGKKSSEKEDSRLTQIGYTELSQRARVGKRTVQNIVDRLIAKGFITIEKPADIFTRSATVYRVLGYAAALRHMRERNRNHVVRTGNGIFYAQTVAFGPLATVVAGSQPTVATDPTVTVESGSRPTVEPVATQSLGTKPDRQEKTKPSSSFVVIAVRPIMGDIDNTLAGNVIAACRAIDPQATEEEIAHFAHQAASRVKAPGGLPRATAEFFTGDATAVRLYRAEKAAVAERSREAAEQGRESARGVLADPHATEQEREWARSVLAV